MPAAFPAFTTISRAARTEVWAGAMRVSSATGLPSARMETQVVSSARISRVKVVSGLAAAGAGFFASGALAAALGGLVAGWFAADLVAIPLAEAVVDGRAEGGLDAGVGEGADGAAPGRVIDVRGVGVVAAVIVPPDDFPADCGPRGDAWAPFFSELDEAVG